MTVIRLLVIACSLIVPRPIRRGWADEWLGELLASRDGAGSEWAVTARMIALLPGLVLDAVATRRHRAALAIQRSESAERQLTQREAGMDGMWNDVTQVFRSLVKRPGYVLVATGTLGLGIGATTAMFSAVHSVLLRDLPYGDTDRVFVVQQVDQRDGRVTDGVSAANVGDIAEATRAIERIGVADGIHGLRLVRDGRAESLRAWVVSDGFLEALDARATIGRLFSAEEYEQGGPPVVLLSHATWTERFGGDPSVVGQALVLDDVAHEVVGVLPADFRYPSAPDAWTARPVQPEDEAGRGQPRMQGIARLRPDVALTDAQSELDAIAADLRTTYPEQNEYLGFRLVTLRHHLLGDVRSPLILLLAAVSMVLLVASANVAGLQLARGTARSREYAVRRALGANRHRILRLSAIESLALATIGGVVGLGLANVGVWMIELLGPNHLPRIDEIRIDRTVLAFGCVAALGSALVAGIIPALTAARVPPWRALGSTRGATRGRNARGLQDRLVVAEIAVAVTLTIGAGLLLRSFDNVLDNELGFSPRNLIAAQVWAYDDQHRPSFDYFELASEALRSLPGVERVGITSDLPLASDDQLLARTITVGVAIDGAGEVAGAGRVANLSVIDRAYTGVMGLELVSGRGFGPDDDSAAPAVALVNAAFVRRYLANENPIGRRVTPAFRDEEPREIVGVVSDVRRGGLETEPDPEVYLHIRQVPFNGLTFVVRTAAGAGAMVQGVREGLLETDPDQAVWAVQAVDDLLVERTRRRRFDTTLLTVFAGLSLLLAAVGIYGLTAFSVEQRVSEFGVRRALGSSTHGILNAILGDAARLSLTGVALGLAGGVVVAQVLRSMLFGISPTDPLTFLAIAVVVVACTLLAACLAARRATRIEPVVALARSD